MELLFQQLYTFIIMFVFGILLGGVFGIYRSLSSRIRRKSGLLLKVTDLFFGLLAGTMAFLILLYANWGELRFYVVLAIMAGSASYFYLVKLIKGG